MRYGANVEFEYQEKPKEVVSVAVSGAATVEVKIEPEVVEIPVVVPEPVVAPEPETPVIENQGVKENWRSRRKKAALPYGIKETEETKE